MWMTQIKALFHESDTNLSEGLDPVQMKDFLTRYKGEEVTDATVNYVLLVVHGVSGSREITEDDIVTAVSTWQSLADDQDKVREKFDAFDRDNTGMLSTDQVKEMLTFMNDGVEVTDAEAAWVIKQADFSCEGTLRKDEINAAVAVWYTKVTEEHMDKSCVCTIL